jgi:hypothetical protein
MKYDRRAIMKRAHELRRIQGLDMSAAIKLAWAEAKSEAKSPAVMAAKGTQGTQEAGLAACPS